MKKQSKMKQVRFSFMIIIACIFLVMGLSPKAKASSANEGGIPVDEDHFPDEAFRNWVNEEIAGGDGMLSEEEISAAQNIYCDNQGITSLAGIKVFANLRILTCSGNQLTTLDLSGCSSLQSVSWSNNPLISVNVSGCVSLESLAWCGTLDSLDASGCTALTYIGNYCHIKNLNLSGCSSLLDLREEFWEEDELPSDHLEHLNVSNCSSLEILYCDNVGLLSIELSGCSHLKVLGLNGNELKDIDLRDCIALETLNCENNRLTTLEVDSCTNLVSLSCSGNELSSLDVHTLTGLRWLSCSQNGLTNLQLCDSDQGCTELEQLFCTDNNLTVINLRGFNLGDFLAQYVQMSGRTYRLMPQLIDGTHYRISSPVKPFYSLCWDENTFVVTPRMPTTIPVRFRIVGGPDEDAWSYNEVGGRIQGSCIQPQAAPFGGEIVRPEDPSRPHYAFDGWYTDSSCSRKYSFDSVIYEGGEIILYGRWIFLNIACLFSLTQVL